MPTYYLTVGQKYRQEEHPGGLHPDYYYSFEAENEQAAREHIISLFGEKWAFIYNKKNIQPMYFNGEHKLEDSMAPNPFEDYNSVEKWSDESKIDNASLSAKLYCIYTIINRMLDRLDKIEQRLCDDDLK